MNWWQRRRKTGQLEDQLDAELQYHFERQVEDNIRAGMPEAEARQQPPKWGKAACGAAAGGGC